MTENDDEVWAAAVRDVSPLPEANIISSTQKKKRQVMGRIETVPFKIYKHTVALDGKADIDRNTMRRFKRGEFPIEASLDLHGYTEQQAFEAVHKFMTSAYMSGKRCVIIVTGKGLKHQDEDVFAAKGVLKQRVPQWLNSDELRQLILTYIHPAEKLGGQGALLILLRRKRA